MKMKGQLESAQPMKKHKTKSKKNELKKKKQGKLESKKQTKEKQDTKPKASVTAKQETVAITSTVIETASDTSLSNASRRRASKSLTAMTKEEQLIAINHIIKRLLLDEMTQGEALRELRVDVLGLRQEAYIQLTGVSRKTLSEIENDKGNYTAEIINKVFKPFDLKVGLVPTSSQLLAAILTN